MRPASYTRRLALLASCALLGTGCVMGQPIAAIAVEPIEGLPSGDIAVEGREVAEFISEVDVVGALEDALKQVGARGDDALVLGTLATTKGEAFTVRISGQPIKLPPHAPREPADESGDSQ